MQSFLIKQWKQIRLFLEKLLILRFQTTSTKAYSNRILCVDDDRDFCDFIEKLGDSLGIYIDRVYSIQQAKQKIEKNQTYNAYIIDGHFSDGSGFELISWIREKKRIDVPIGFLSRIFQDAASFRLLKEGFEVDYVLDKPITPEVGCELLKQLCKQQLLASGSHNVALEKYLEDLKKKYQKTIPDKVESLQRLILSFQKNPSKETLNELKREVHKIAGSAGSYGYPVVSALCREIELELIKRESLIEKGDLKTDWAVCLDEFFTRFKLYFQVNIDLLNTDR